jgi:arylsulfatase A
MFPAAFRRLSLISLLWLIALAGLVLSPGVQRAEAAERPNVVLIVADDLGWADLGCYGSKFHRTPHLDRLAAEGVRFTDAYAACPVCSPTRAALMTGMYPPRFQITDWLPGRADRPDQRLRRPELRQQLPLEAITIAEVLREAGYKTAHIGKWHLGGEGFSPLEQGFELNIGGDHTGTPLSYFAPFKGPANAARPRFMPGLEEAPEGEYLTDRYALEAERFLEANKDKPFLLYVPHNGVHTPMRAKQELVDKYPQPPQLGRQSNAIYAAMLESVDDSVGRIIAKLEALGLAENTLVIFTSDNGGLATLEGPNTPATINAPLREGKGYLYEGGIRVALIVKWPGNAAKGLVASEPCISHDLVATIAEACGVKFPAAIDGRSLVATLRSEERAESTPLHEALYWHYPHYSNQGGKPGGAVRQGEFKLVEFYDDGRRELFNVASDPSESRNLAAEKPEVVERLAALLADWRKEVGALMPEPNPEFVPNPPDAKGVIQLHARTAQVHGAMLRYEPLPHKETLGYWVNADDFATFEFTVKSPGRYVATAWQGCGDGHGGSTVEFAVGDQAHEMIVEETGGFQNFKPRVVGEFEFPSAGRYALAVRAKSKAKAAVMDLRVIRLEPAK